MLCDSATATPSPPGISVSRYRQVLPVTVDLRLQPNQRADFFIKILLISCLIDEVFLCGTNGTERAERAMSVPLTK